MRRDELHANSKDSETEHEQFTTNKKTSECHPRRQRTKSYTGEVTLPLRTCAVNTKIITDLYSAREAPCAQDKTTITTSSARITCKNHRTRAFCCELEAERKQRDEACALGEKCSTIRALLLWFQKCLKRRGVSAKFRLLPSTKSQIPRLLEESSACTTA